MTLEERIARRRRALLLRTSSTVPPYSIQVQGDNHSNFDASIPGDDSASVVVSKKMLVGIAERVVWPPRRWFGGTTKLDERPPEFVKRSSRNQKEEEEEEEGAWRELD